jgi:hypothetical protein
MPAIISGSNFWHSPPRLASHTALSMVRPTRITRISTSFPGTPAKIWLLPKSKPCTTSTWLQSQAPTTPAVASRPLLRELFKKNSRKFAPLHINKLLITSAKIQCDSTDGPELQKFANFPVAFKSPLLSQYRRKLKHKEQYRNNPPKMRSGCPRRSLPKQISYVNRDAY